MQILGSGGTGGGSGLAGPKAHYATLWLSSLPDRLSISQLAFMAGAPKACFY